MVKTLAEIQASIESKLEADTKFQSSLEGLSDEDKTNWVNERKQSDIDAEIARLDEEREASKKQAEVNANQKVRAEKAEAELKKLKGDGGTPNNPPDNENLSSDLYALMRNNVPEEDVPEIKDYAILKKITVVEALKTPFIKARLATLAEERESAKATNTRSGARGTGSVSGETLLDKAISKGELPESDSDMEKLVKARLGVK